MKKLIVTALVLGGLCLDLSSAHADILTVNCRSSMGAGFSSGDSGSALTRQIAYERARSRTTTCLGEVIADCPAGTVSAGITDRVECTSDSQACSNINFNGGGCLGAPTSDVSPAQGYFGSCCIVSCKLVKSCIVPGT